MIFYQSLVISISRATRILIDIYQGCIMNLKEAGHKQEAAIPLANLHMMIGRVLNLCGSKHFFKK